MFSRSLDKSYKIDGKLAPRGKYTVLVVLFYGFDKDDGDNDRYNDDGDDDDNNVDKNDVFFRKRKSKCSYQESNLRPTDY